MSLFSLILFGLSIGGSISASLCAFQMAWRGYQNTILVEKKDTKARENEPELELEVDEIIDETMELIVK